MSLSLERRGITLMIAAAFCFSIMMACSKHLAATLPVMEVVFFRSFITALLTLPFLVALRASPFGSSPFLISLRGFVGFVSLSLNFYAHAHLSLNDASTLGQTSVLFTPILAFVFLRERISALVAVLTGIAFVGVLLILRPTSEMLNIPGCAGLLSGLMSGTVYIMIRKLHATDHWSTIVFAFSAISCLMAALVAGSSFIIPSWSDIPIVLILGGSGTIAQYFMTSALRYAPAPIVTPYTFMQVIFSFTWSAVVWQATPDALSLLGSLLVILCGVGIIRVRASTELERTVTP